MCGHHSCVLGDILLVELEKLLLELVFLFVDEAEVVLHELLYVDIFIARATSGGRRSLSALGDPSTLGACCIFRTDLRVLALDAVKSFFLFFGNAGFLLFAKDNRSGVRGGHSFSLRRRS